MRFSQNYSKLKNNVFTTIREDKEYYWPRKIIPVYFKKDYFKKDYLFHAEVVSVKKISIHDIDDDLAYADADMSSDHLKTMLQRMYKNRVDFKGYVLITLEVRAGIKKVKYY